MKSKQTWRPVTDRVVTKQRANLFSQIRAFMQAREIIEVDTPVLSRYGISDPFIEQIRAELKQDHLSSLYLHTSPEYCMKRLLAAGIGDCYQIAHVFRDEEKGKQHTLEFAMLEWYRLGYNYLDLINEVEDLLLLLKLPKPERQSYQNIFETTVGIDPMTAKIGDMQTLCKESGWSTATTDRHDCLDFLFSHRIVDHLANDSCLIVYDYPACMASLAKLNEDNKNVCERFELFINGIEIANGFTELVNADEQRQRFIDELEKRKLQDKHIPPMDDLFLNALESGLPECAGVALGLDRLLMIMLNKTHINEVNYFTLDNN
ncbi:MAG: EF-P lysine aminoacylase EpmA [Pseudomonadota bacterium]